MLLVFLIPVKETRIELKYVIKFCAQLKKTLIETVEMVRTVYSYDCIYFIIKFKGGCDPQKMSPILVVYRKFELRLK